MPPTDQFVVVSHAPFVAPVQEYVVCAVAGEAKAKHIVVVSAKVKMRVMGYPASAEGEWVILRV